MCPQPAEFQPRPTGRQPQETAPRILETAASDDYALIDSGNGHKLERYGAYRIIRPEEQAIWQPALPDMVAHCRAILSSQPLGIILTAYFIRASFYAIHEFMRDQFTGLGGMVQSGKLILREEITKRTLSTSLFSRWISKPQDP